MAAGKNIKQGRVERMCAVCRRRLPKKELMRFVVDSEGYYHIDMRAKAQGRGKYLCYDDACMEAMFRTDKKRPFKLDKESLAILEGLHAAKKEQAKHSSSGTRREAELLNLLGLARKADKLSLGFDATADAIRKDQVKLLVMATDLSSNSLDKISELIIEHKVPSISVLSSQDLGPALGREQLAIVGLTDSGLADKFTNILIGQQLDLETDIEDK
ncbi:MAG: DUF448 domain-containing protein [Eubacteriales bacterium]|nr:DUF448 domain-containing protein [Eubacteriales bacterium]